MSGAAGMLPRLSEASVGQAGLDATEVAPAVVRRGDRTTLLVGELRDPGTERVSLLASHLPHAQVTERILGCLWTALAQDAVLAAASVTGQPLAEVLAARGTSRCCSRSPGRYCPGHPRRPSPSAASTRPTCPARSPGSPRPAGPRRPGTRRPTWTWRYGTGRARSPPSSATGAVPWSSGPSSSCKPSSGPARVLAGQPGPAGRPRAAGAARPAAQRGVRGDRRPGPGP